MFSQWALRLEQFPFAVSIAESAWAFPVLETIHVGAISLVVGSIGMIDIRLLGLGLRTRRASDWIAHVLPWTWIAFSFALVTGALMFASKAHSYLDNPYFLAKMVCLALAGTNMLTFHLLTARGIASWELGKPPAPARAAGAFSLCLWITTVALGRWIGFV
jgi:uncharacterized protein DUF6644